MEQNNELYHPLDPGRREFRLVRILYTGSSEIECHLEVFSLNEIPVYTALSYAWTEDEASRQILLNGKAFPVRPNLHEFLKQMHAEQHSGWIFIDAICINQNEDAEKASQIGLMGSLFGTAQEVVAWQGVDFEYKGQRVSVSGPLELYLEAFVAYWSGHSFDTPISELELVFPAGLAFFQWSYWSRLWIAQEIILARALTIRFNRFQLGSGKALSLLATVMEDIRPDFEVVDFRSRLSRRKSASSFSVRAAFQFLTYREQLLDRSIRSRSISLRAAINMLSGQECTRKYDTIYGLLGLTESPLVVNYAVPILDLYLRVFVEGLYVNPGEGLPSEHQVLLYANLLIGLHISPWHPVVAFATIHCLKIAGLSEDGYVAYLRFARMVECISDMMRNEELNNDDNYKCKELTRLKLQLRFAHASRFRMRGPAERGKGRTLEEWAEVAENILEDVQKKILQAKFRPWTGLSKNSRLSLTAESGAGLQGMIVSSSQGQEEAIGNATILAGRIEDQDKRIHRRAGKQTLPALRRARSSPQ